jgi:hypothetical protein
MRNRRQESRGQAFVETALILLPTVLLLLCTLWVGEAEIRELTTTQVARDAASMYSRGADFSVAAANPDNSTYNFILPKLASTVGTLNSSANTPPGTGVVIFSNITFLGTGACPNGQGTGTGKCENYGQFVFTQQYAVGNTGLRVSNFGTPTNTDPSNAYNITPANYENAATDVASFSFTNSSYPAVTTGGPNPGYQPGQPIYVVEAFFSGLGTPGSSLGVTYAYAIF